MDHHPVQQGLAGSKLLQHDQTVLRARPLLCHQHGPKDPEPLGDLTARRGEGVDPLRRLAQTKAAGVLSRHK